MQIFGFVYFRVIAQNPFTLFLYPGQRFHSISLDYFITSDFMHLVSACKIDLSRTFSNQNWSPISPSIPGRFFSLRRARLKKQHLGGGNRKTQRESGRIIEERPYIYSRLIHGFHNSTVRLKTRNYSKFSCIFT